VKSEWVLFTWELRERSRRRRWFYVKLRRLLTSIPATEWARVGGSVYVVRRRHSWVFQELLKRFQGSELEWYRFEILESAQL
jgi:hypothetical protein